jgi:hypothetical protein
MRKVVLSYAHVRNLWKVSLPYRILLAVASHRFPSVRLFLSPHIICTSLYFYVYFLLFLLSVFITF